MRTFSRAPVSGSRNKAMASRKGSKFSASSSVMNSTYDLGFGLVSDPAGRPCFGARVPFLHVGLPDVPQPRLPLAPVVFTILDLLARFVPWCADLSAHFLDDLLSDHGQN